MGSRVGSKGQIVIAKEIRDQLGVEPGWVAVQRLVDDHVEVRFLPPPHYRSLKGSLAPYIKARPTTDDWTAIRDSAWEAEVRERAASAELG
jgi:AbrB family looped-hinge helix DNA binding protein